MLVRSKPGIRRRAASLLVVALLAGAVSAVVVPGPAGAQRPPKPESSSPEAELAVAAAAVGGEVVEAPGGGPVTFVGTPVGQSLAVDGGGTTPRAAAQAFVEEYGPAFGVPDPAEDLTVDRTTPMAAGGKAVHYQQLEGGVPVMAGELNVQVAPGGKVRSAGGELSTGGAVDVRPTVTAAVATTAAVDATAADAGVAADVLTGTTPVLWVYDPALIDESGDRRLVWRLEVRSDEASVRAEVLVDAQTGDVALLLDEIMTAKNRQVCDNANVLGASYSCPAAGVARGEGGPASGVSEVNKAYELSGATYDYYLATFGRDSINGAGMTLYSTVRHCPIGEGCPYANAFWDGVQMVYGDTYAGADDVVGHELTHGVTEYESNLVYANQSGAINESMSDVFGEFVDLAYDSSFDNDTAGARWLMGEDLPIGAIRDMEHPPNFGDPDRMGSPNFYTGSGDSGGVHTNSGVNNKAAFLMTDGGSFNGQTVTSLGTTKVARIYYEVNTNILTSGSDYGALGNALNQGCANLVGVNGITAADCTEVAKAVTATEMVVPAPANDNFADAQTITGTSGTVTGTTLGATRQSGEPNHGGGTGSLVGTASVWYEFTAAGTGTATLTTCNSDFDTLLGVYTGSAVNALTIVGQNDDNGVGACVETNGSLRSRLQFAVTQGATYRIAVDGYGTAKGGVSLNWTLPAAPVATGVSGTVTESGTGTPVAGAMVAVLNSSTFAIAGGGVADGSGNYSAQVPAGTYFLYVIDPSGNHTAGFFGAPTLVTVTNGTMVDKDPTMASVIGSIGGTVTEDGTNAAVAGAYAVALSGTTGAPESAAVANGSGQFTRGGLRAGNHLVVYVDPAGAHRSEFFNNSPGPGGAANVAVTGGATATANASLATQATTPGGALLTGTVTESGTGTPLQGVLVIASRASDYGVAVAGTTNASGQYSLNATFGAGYKLQFLDPSGLHDMEWHNNQPYFGIANAATVTAPAVTNAALDRRLGTMAGTVSAEVSASPLAGAWVLAIGPSGIAGGAVTAANGTYSVAGLPAGTYRATFVDPVGGHTQEYFHNSADYAGATPITITGGATTTVDEALSHP